MIDEHLAELRRAKSLRLGGMSYTSIGDRLGYPWQTIRKMIQEANELRSQGKLYADMNVQEEDMYTVPSMRKRLTLVNGGAQ